MIKEIVKLVRLRQTPKNLVVLSAPIASGEFLRFSIMANAVLVMIGFTIVSFGVYALNDVVDRHNDRVHPTKQFRPIASGAISPMRGVCLAGTFFLAGFATALTVGYLSALIVGAYVLLNISYSGGLKNLPVVEVMVVASGFVLRVIAGLLITPGPRTPGFVQSVFFGSLLIVLAKRTSEYLVAAKSRPVLSQYSHSYLIVGLAVAATAFLVTYMDFALTQVGETWQFSDLPIGLSTLPILFVTLEIPRLALLGESGEPEVLFWKRKVMRYASILFLYLGHLLLQ